MLKAIKWFEIVLNKIAIHGVPRSGTSWLGEIFNSSVNTLYKFQPLFSYTLKDFLDENSDKAQIEFFFKILAEKRDNFLDQVENRKAGILPCFYKKDITHIIYKEVRYHNLLHNMLMQIDDIKLIAIIRNPIEVLVSWFNAPREFRRDKGWNEMAEWRFAEKKNLGKKEEFFGYERWKEATKIFLSLKEIYPQKVFIVFFRDLVNDTTSVTKKLYKFCKLKFCKQTEEFLEKCQKINIDNPYSVFKIKKVRKKLDFKYIEIINFIKEDLERSHLKKFLEK